MLGIICNRFDDSKYITKLGPNSSVSRLRNILSCPQPENLQ